MLLYPPFAAEIDNCASPFDHRCADLPLPLYSSSLLLLRLFAMPPQPSPSFLYPSRRPLLQGLTGLFAPVKEDGSKVPPPDSPSLRTATAKRAPWQGPLVHKSFCQGPFWERLPYIKQNLAAIIRPPFWPVIHATLNTFVAWSLSSWLWTIWHRPWQQLSATSISSSPFSQLWHLLCPSLFFLFHSYFSLLFSSSPSLYLNAVVRSLLKILTFPRIFPVRKHYVWGPGGGRKSMIPPFAPFSGLLYSLKFYWFNFTQVVTVPQFLTVFMFFHLLVGHDELVPTKRYFYHVLPFWEDWNEIICLKVVRAILDTFYCHLCEFFIVLLSFFPYPIIIIHIFVTPKYGTKAFHMITYFFCCDSIACWKYFEFSQE